MRSAVRQTGCVPVYLPAQHGDVCTAVAPGDGWGDSSCSDGSAFPCAWSDFFEWRGCPAAGWNDTEQRCYTSVLSWPATLVHGLRLLREAGAPLPSGQPPTTLRLHLLGAMQGSEAPQLAKYEEVLHCLPGVQRLELALVGPQLGGKGDGEQPEQPRLCQDCESRGRSLHISFHHTSYHQFASQRQPAAASGRGHKGAAGKPGRSAFAFSFGSKPKASKAPPVTTPASQGGFDPLGKKLGRLGPTAPGAALGATGASSAAAPEHVHHADCSCAGKACHSREGSRMASPASGSQSPSGESARQASAGAEESSAGGWVEPHAAFMLNSGLHEDSEEHQQAWLPTLRWLRDAGVPTLLTAYTAQEAQDDLAVLTRERCRVIVQPQENAFANQVPLVDCVHRFKVYHVNWYLLAFQGKA
ncbi:hypothetical protein N2152v2_005984 [Parachlorella kessleri]